MWDAFPYDMPLLFDRVASRPERDHRAPNAADAGSPAAIEGDHDRSIGEPPCARRCRRTDARKSFVGRLTRAGWDRQRGRTRSPYGASRAPVRSLDPPHEDPGVVPRRRRVSGDRPSGPRIRSRAIAPQPFGQRPGRPWTPRVETARSMAANNSAAQTGPARESSMPAARRRLRSSGRARAIRAMTDRCPPRPSPVPGSPERPASHRAPACAGPAAARRPRLAGDAAVGPEGRRRGEPHRRRVRANR